MEITVSHEQGRVPVTVFHIAGVIDSSNYEQLDRMALESIQAGTRYLLIDLTKVQFMSSAAFRSLMKVFQQLRSRSGGAGDEELHKEIITGTYKSPYLKLLKPSKAVTETLKLAGFDMIFEIHNNLKKAIASF